MMSLAQALISGVLLGAAPTFAQPAATLQVSGYVQPQLGATVRPDALPRDQWQLGLRQSRAGLLLEGEPIEQWGYGVHLLVAGETGQTLQLEEATIRYRAMEHLAVRAGQMRVPFTLQHSSANTELIFPTRSAPNNAFLSGIDLGLLATSSLANDRILLHAGIFNGGGLQTGQPVIDQTSHRGVLLASRVEYMPLGAFDTRESDLDRGPLRVGIGVGALVAPTQLYDTSGFQGQRQSDLRLTGSLRVHARGFAWQAEAFHRRRTDSLTARPDIATGAYMQAAYLLGRIEPVGRVGLSLDDQGFDPRQTRHAEVGFNAYLAGSAHEPDALRASAVYFHEARISEGERAHGALLQLQMRFGAP